MLCDSLREEQVAAVKAFLTVGSCRRQKRMIGTKPTVGKTSTVATGAVRVRGSRRAVRAGFTLIELFAAMTILLLLTAVALPMARVQVHREREVELRRDLRDLRQAIDRYKDFFPTAV